MKTLTLALVALTGCGTVEIRTVCVEEGLTVKGELELHCPTVAYNVALARELLDHESILPASEFAAAFAGMPITVHDADSLNGADGTYGPADGIQLTTNATALLHEMLHHLTYAHSVLGIGASGHAGWESNGYHAADKEFTRRSFNPRLHWAVQ